LEIGENFLHKLPKTEQNLMSFTQAPSTATDTEAVKSQSSAQAIDVLSPGLTVGLIQLAEGSTPWIYAGILILWCLVLYDSEECFLTIYSVSGTVSGAEGSQDAQGAVLPLKELPVFPPLRIQPVVPIGSHFSLLLSYSSTTYVGISV
jgi:hypothetical protein